MHFLNKLNYSLIIVAICSWSCNKSKTTYSYIGKQAHGVIVIDGKLGEPAWQHANEITLKENNTGNEVDDSTFVTRVRSCYDKNNFYVAFTCNDPDIWSNYTQRDAYLWKEEVVEVFIDTDDNPDDYIEIEVSPSNVLFDSFIINPEHIDFVETSKFYLAHIQTAVSVDGTLNVRNERDQHWVVEIAIPFKDMIGGNFPEDFTGKRWKINFYRVNRDGNKEAGLYAWSPTKGRFHTPSRFGIYCFK